MKQLLQYIIIRLTTRHASTAVDVFERIFHPTPLTPIFFLTNDKEERVTVIENPKDKRTEIVEALEYLITKPNKTKGDKNSISMLEGVLGAMA